MDAASESLKGSYSRCTIREVLAAVPFNYLIDTLWSYTCCFCSHLRRTQEEIVRHKRILQKRVQC